MTTGKMLWRNRKERKEWARRLQSEDPGLEATAQARVQPGVGRTPLFGNHNNFVLRHGVERSFVNAQMGHHQFRRCVGKPLR